MSDTAIRLSGLGKMYKLYNTPVDKALDALGLNRVLFWRRNRYSEFWALRGMDLSIKRGERLGIIGSNGAGKSTMLKIICGNVSATEGAVTVNGRVQALMELGTGFHPEFTGLQNIRASLAYQNLSKNQIREKEEEIIDFAELEEFIEHPVKTYSAGMYARLAFSTATAIKPEILIIDEVLGAGDAYFGGKCIGRMKDLTDKGNTTVLFVSHDLRSVQALCDRVIWLKRGRVVDDGEPLAVVKSYHKEVQKRENLRLKAKSQGLSRNQAIAIDKTASNSVLLFHLTTPNGSDPIGTHSIRHIKLRFGEQTLGEIAVGDPMDNDPNEPARLLCQKGYVNWSEPQSDETGYYRAYSNCGGRYVHAPFEFIPDLELSNVESGRQPLILEITGEVDPCEQVCVEIYKDGTYKRLGTIQSGQNSHRFEISPSDISGSLSAFVETTATEEKTSSTCRFSFGSDNDSFRNAPMVSRVCICTRTGEEVYSHELSDGNDDYFRLLGEQAWDISGQTTPETGTALMSAEQKDLPGFEIKLPFGEKKLLTEYRMVLYATASASHACRIFLNRRGAAIPIGEIFPEENPSMRKYLFDLDIVTTLDAELQTDISRTSDKSVITWQVPNLRIVKVQFLDKTGQLVTGIEEGGDLTVEITYYSSSPIRHPVFAVTIYLLDGTNICHANTALAGLDIDEVHGQGKVRFMFTPFLGGPNEYVVSIGIFEHLDPSKLEQLPLHDQHDRAYRFRVWKDLGIALNLGIVRLSYKAEHLTGNNNQNNQDVAK